MRKRILFIGVFLIGLSISQLVEAASTDHFSLKQPMEFKNKIDETIVIPVNHKQKVDGIEIHVPDLVLSAEGLALYVESSEKAPKKTGRYLRAGDIEFRLTDEQGKEITSHSGEVIGTRHSGKWIFSSEKTFDPITKNVKKLKITPYLMLPTNGGGVEMDKNKDRKDIQFNYSKLKDVEFESFSVKIPH